MNLRTCKAMAVASACLFVAAVGCTDTTVEPKSTVTEANVFNDPSSYQAFIARVYAGLAITGQQGAAGQADISGIDEGFSQYLRLYWEAQELPTDEAVIGWGDVGLPELNTMTWASNNSMVNALYYRVYFQVGMANEFLRQTEDAKLNARGNVSSSLRASIQTWRAEARFLRALSYWHGLDIFGPNIPLVTDADQLGNTPPQPATGTQVYDYIIAELTAVIPDLPAAGAANYGRATDMAARMLLAKVYLNAGVYTGTAQYAQVLTALAPVLASPAFSLAPVYQHNFLADNNTSPEIIFPVTQDGLRTQTWGGMTFLVHASCGGDMNNANYGIDGCWWGIRLKQQAYNLISADPRHTGYLFTQNQSPSVTNIGDFRTGIAAPKYSNLRANGSQGSHATHVDTDWVMFRLADAYLMYAEAVVRGGGGTTAQAETYFNALRQRAYGNTSADLPVGTLAVGSAAALDTLLAERVRELVWEGHRRQDLIRFGRFTGNAYTWEWRGGTQAGVTSASSHLGLYPLPASELVANPNLNQNPGY